MRPIKELKPDAESTPINKDLKPEKYEQSIQTRDFNQLVINSKDYVSRLAYKLAEVTTNILSTSKGRNKICSLIQYHAKLIFMTTINSNIPEVQDMMM